MPRFLCSLVLAALAACYQPSYPPGVACGPGGACPDGLTCRTDGRCWSGDDPADSGPGVDPRDASGGGPADGGLPDAAPVACRGDGECQAPPTLCQLPGTCDLEAGACVFPAVDCSSLDGECTRGSCELATGACVAEGINQDESCGAGEVCGPFSVCESDGVGDVCDTIGVQTHECDVSTCQAGECRTLEDVPRTARCKLNTTGITCDETTVDCVCDYPTDCAETGTENCTCTSYTCSDGACTSTSQSCDPQDPQDCTRERDGERCGPGRVCSDDVCVPDPCQFCVAPGRSGPA